MNLEVSIRFPDGVNHIYGMDFYRCSYNIIFIPDEIYLAAYKIHNHLYEVRYFLYKSKEIGFYSFRGLKEMYNFVQNLLKVKLFDVEQKQEG